MIISISGQDTYRSREKLHSIQQLGLKKQAKQEVFDFSDIQLPETEDTLLAKLKQSFNNNSLFLEKRFIIVKSLTSLPKTFHTKIKKILNTIKDNSETILLFYEIDNIPKTNPLAKTLIDLQAKQTQYDHLPEAKAMAYLHQMSLEQGLDIARDSIMYLVDIQRQEHKQKQEKESNKSKKTQFIVDFYKIELIFNQIYNYYGNQKITKPMLETLFPLEINHSIFSLADYIYTHKYGQYLTALQAIEKIGIEGIALYALLISQIKTALIIKLAQEEGESYNNYIKGHPYVLQKTSQNIRNWELKDLKYIYLKLIEGDYSIKFEGQDPYVILQNIGINLLET
ncbi:MAG: hypothetical protein RLZZ223_29 [Candidatus Parcubacteria bacterium]|jgi:DNA polymerase III delta subunit